MKSSKRPTRYNKKKVESSEEPSSTIYIKLKNGKRYAHTSSCGYQITMASLQPDDRQLPNCACNMVNKGKRKSDLDDKVILIVEHDLKEHILCILDSKQLPQCKLNVQIQPGEQVSYRTVGDIPVQMSGVILSSH